MRTASAGSGSALSFWGVKRFLTLAVIWCNNGEGEIRTRGTLSGTLVFETSTISHSVTSPDELLCLVPLLAAGADNESEDCTLSAMILQETVV